MEIKFNHVEFSYGDKLVLKDIDFTIQSGMITGIIGKSGSGKTTLIQLINGLLLPTKGSVEVGTFVLEPHKRIQNINDLRFNVGMVFQFPEDQFFHTTVFKEVGFGLEQFNYKKDRKERIYISKLDPFKQIIDKKLEENNIPATGIYYLLNTSFSPLKFLLVK